MNFLILLSECADNPGTKLNLLDTSFVERNVKNY